MTEVYIPVSVGELFDKITILEIKKQKITCEKQIMNISKELTLLQNIASTIDQTKISDFILQLKKINFLLWEIEEKKRCMEKTKVFNNKFIELSRLVYIYNDKRAAIKKQINLITNSIIVEEKSYEKDEINLRRL